MAQTVLTQVLLLSLMMLLGYLLGKSGYMKKEHSDFLSRLLLDVFFPCNVLVSACSDFGEGDKLNTLVAIVFYFALLMLFTLIGTLTAKLMRMDRDHALVLSRSVGFPNNGFMGLPLCAAVFGAKGAVWSALSVPGTTFYMFAVTMMAFQRGKDGEKQSLRTLVNPLNISVALMIVMVVTGLKLPRFLQSVCSSFGGCTTPAAMLVVGYLLSASPLLDTLRKPAIYVSTLLRNLICPLLAAVLFRFTGWDTEMCLCLVMVLGCSVGSTVGIFAARYDRAPEFASQCVLQSSLLLPVTMPVMMVFAEKILM